MENKHVETIVREFTYAKSNRTNWETYWAELAKYIQPMKNDVYGSRAQGEKRGHELYDGEAIQCNETLAAYLHTMLTNPSTHFLGFDPRRQDLTDNDNVKSFLGQVTNTFHSVLNNSNFQTEIHEVYLDLGSIGTSVMFIEEDDKNIINFSTRNIWECYPVENSSGTVDTLYRSFKWPLSKIADKWPEALSQEMRERLVVAPQEEYEIVHCVKPRASKDRPYGDLYGPKSMPFSSTYVLMKDKTLLEEDGFEEFPFIVPRWTKLAGETYGRSCGMKALPDIKTLNKMAEITLKAAQLNIAPPFNVPDDGYHGGLKLKPLGINYYRAGTKDRAEPMLTGVRTDIGLDMMNVIRSKIQRAFFVDKMALREGPQKTAAEVNRLSEDDLRAMAPVLGRQHNETLKPLATRVLGILNRKKLLPPVPTELKGVDVDIVYSSQIAKVQKINEANNFLRGIQAAGQLLGVKPELLDNIDGDKAVRYILRAYSAPEIAIAKESTIRDTRAARAKAQQEQVEMQKSQAGAETLNKMAPMMGQIAGGE